MTTTVPAPAPSRSVLSAPADAWITTQPVVPPDDVPVHRVAIGTGARRQQREGV
jgi:hypothetical protein